MLSIDDQRRVNRQTTSHHGVLVGEQALIAITIAHRVACDECDTMMAVGNEMCNRLLHPGSIIRGNTWMGFARTDKNNWMPAATQILDVVLLGQPHGWCDYNQSVGIPRPNRNEINVGCQHGPGSVHVAKPRDVANTTRQQQMTSLVGCSGTNATQQGVQVAPNRGSLVHLPAHKHANREAQLAKGRRDIVVHLVCHHNNAPKSASQVDPFPIFAP